MIMDHKGPCGQTGYYEIKILCYLPKPNRGEPTGKKYTECENFNVEYIRNNKPDPYFFFKFYNNILGLNIRTSHFVPNQNRNCTFCSASGQMHDESFIHLFFDCHTTRGWQEKFVEKYILPRGDLTREEKIGFFFFGTLPGLRNDNTFVGMAALIFQYCVWEQKLTKKNSFLQFTGC